MRWFFHLLIFGIITRCVAFTSTSSSSSSKPLSIYITFHSRPSINIGETSEGVCMALGVAASNTDDNAIVEEQQLSKCTVVQLKDKLRELGLTVGGKKSELIERLNDYYLSQTPIVDSSTSVGAPVGSGDNNPTTIEIEEDLSKLTVPALKERLRDFALPVGGKKAELIERLQTAMKDASAAAAAEDDSKVFTHDNENDIIVATNNDMTDKADVQGEDTLSDILDDIFDDIDDEEEDEDALLDENLSTKQLEAINESSSSRRAKRKKYWKSQEVRELMKANDPHASIKAEEMIETLKLMAKEEDDGEYLPSEHEYTLLIDAYANIGTAEAIHKAEATIDHILEKSSDDADAIQPTAKMLNALIGAWAAIGTVEAAEKATGILEKMEYLQEFGGSVKPTVHSYSIVISAWGKCQSEMAAQNAENILNRLFENYDNVLLKSVDQNEYYADQLKPNGIVFNSAIDAWAMSGSPNAGEKVETLLHRMENLSRLDEYDVRPDTISFNTCIKAWCNSNRPDAPLKAEQVLSKLETNPQYPKRNGGVLIVRPNKLSYNTCINAWAKSNLPEAAARAEGLLLRIVRAFKSETFATIMPDAHTFSSTLNALAKSRTVKDKAQKCSSILKAMIDLHEDDGSYETMPNIICYNTVLNACAFSARGIEAEKRQALAVAVDVFNQMREGKYVSPDAVSYGNMLKSCANLIPPGDQRTAMASRLFAACCDEGLVGGMALDEIRRCIPPRAFLPLLADCGYDKPLKQHRKGHSVELRELPRKFTMNVKRTDGRQRQRASFAKPKRTQEHTRSRRQIPKEKEKPVIRRPARVIEYGASGRDM